MRSTKIKYIILRCAFVGVLVLLVSATKANEFAKPLNFIIIFTDDQGYNDLGCYGSPLIRTPNIDQLAAEGIRFTDFYAQPVCGPSRTSLMTGCYPLRVAEVGNVKRFHPMVHPKEILLPELLRNGGYATGCIGKWDLNGHGQSFKHDDIYPGEMGFDYWFGLPSSNDGGVRRVYRNETLLEDHNFTDDNITKAYTYEAIAFIEKNKTKPFFLYLAHTMPHTKLGASPGFKGKSNYGLYGDCIEEIDWSVGKIKNKLDELGLDENTIILYTSDNGPWRARGTHGGSCFPLRGGKATTWEGGVRVPCVIWGTADLRKGVEVHKVCKTMDVFPTFLSLAGIDMPGDTKIDGQDISSLIVKNSEETNVSELYYYYYYTHLQAVRKGNWKLVLPRPQAPQWLSNSMMSIYRREDMEPVRDLELYNLRTDISERRDVAEKHPEIVKELLTLVEMARQDIGDYDRVGEGARFFDMEQERPDALRWKEEDPNEVADPVKLHPYYDDGARIMKNKTNK